MGGASREARGVFHCPDKQRLKLFRAASPAWANLCRSIRLSCADDDAQGNRLEVIWDYELDRLILEEEGWSDLASKGFDQPRQFAAFLHTLRWNCISATEPNLFHAPFRAGIKIDA
jgi:hypothetical protein